MKKLKIISSKPFLDSDLLRIEMEFGIKFPDFLIEFYREYNGSETLECCYVFNSKSYTLQEFLPITNDLNGTIEDFLPLVRDKERGTGRVDLIPFGIDPGGRLYLISVGEKDYGSVYFSIVGLGFDESIRKIANSFDEFINGLQTEEVI